MPAKVPRRAGVSVGLRPRRSAFSPRGRRARVCGQMCLEGAVRAGTASRLRCGVLRLPALGRRRRLSLQQGPSANLRMPASADASADADQRPPVSLLSPLPS